MLSFRNIKQTSKNVADTTFKPLAKCVLIPSSATDAAIQKKISGSGMTALIISNKEMIDIMKIVKSLKESGLLIKDVIETIENEAKEH